ASTGTTTRRDQIAQALNLREQAIARETRRAGLAPEWLRSKCGPVVRPQDRLCRHFPDSGTVGHQDPLPGRFNSGNLRMTFQQSVASNRPTARGGTCIKTHLLRLSPIANLTTRLSCR